MELEKLLENFEKLLYRVLVLFILVPKTMFRLITRPSFCYDYTATQFDLEEGERFQDHVSPILLIIFTCVIPIYAITKFSVPAEDMSIMPSQTLMIIAFLLVASIPLCFAAFIVLYQKNKLSYDSLKMPLYALLYISFYGTLSILAVTIALYTNASSMLLLTVAFCVLIICSILSLKALHNLYDKALLLSKRKAVIFVFLSSVLVLIVMGAIISCIPDLDRKIMTGK